MDVGHESVQSAAMTLDDSLRTEVADLVRTFGYEHRAEAFALTSGGTSHDYVDGKHAVATGAALKTAAQAMIDVVGEPFDVVGGPTMGADALSHGVSILTGAGWFTIRKEPKGHGRGSWLEGTRLAGGERVLMVEDVVSTGSSLLRAVERVEELGATVIAATALLDRSPRVALRVEAHGIRWVPVLRWSDIGIAPL
jgi:orotate phosphoribosyltransferase